MIDKNGFLWTLCIGNSYDGIKGSLFKTDIKTQKNTDSLHFGELLNIFNSGMQLNQSKDTLYVMYNDIIKIPVTGKIVPETIIDGYVIAELELKEKKIPFIIRRPIPGGGCEYWHLKDLEIISF